jgi:diguanylate cyclase (GGDEF)-like protein
MLQSAKKILKYAMSAIGLGYRIVHGIDYQTLSTYIVKINQHKDIDEIITEISRCFKEILDYELFGFVLKNESSIEVWIDPRVYGTMFVDYIAQDFESQNIGINVHCIENNARESRHNSDNFDMNDLISYKVMDNDCSARLYILPKKKMPLHQDSIISIIISSIAVALEKNLNIRQLENAATIDPLTNCYNRRALNTFISSDIAYARRQGHDLSVIMLDVDNFKEVNDRYGHQAGDRVLQEIAALLRSLIRKSDYIARYGGEEFMLVLPDTTLYHAVQLAEKLRKSIEGHIINLMSAGTMITASFGVASLENKRDLGSLLREVDERLYTAKSKGKNTVVPSLLPCFGDSRFVAKRLSRKYSEAASVA